MMGVMIIDVISRLRHWFGSARLLEELRASWARRDDRVRELNHIRNAYGRISAQSPGADYIDDDTWNDLDMDTVYSEIDRTLTTPGNTGLYLALRKPLRDEQALEKRNALTSAFQSHVAFRETAQLALSMLGREGNADVVWLLWSKKRAAHAITRLLPVMSILAVLAPFLLFVRMDLGLVAMFCVFGVNVIIAHVTRHLYAYHVASLRYLGNMIKAARTICRNDLSRASFPQADELRAIAEATARISTQTSIITPETNSSSDPLVLGMDYISIYFLAEVNAYYSAMRSLAKHETELRRLFELMGELDLCQSVASFREGLSRYCLPEFVSGKAMMQVDNGIHPLVSDPVPNSIGIASEGIFLTGSNMSGKTTFVRMLGTNALLAQTIYTACADKYRASFFRITSSIDQGDELTAGKSYYFNEAERLLKVLQTADGDTGTLCLLDELLRGTNSIERVAISTEILLYLARRNAIVIASSHDVGLAHNVEGVYRHYHFFGSVEGGELAFSYRIAEGICPTRNAIDLLRYLDYPDEVVAGAEARAAAVTEAESHL